MKMFAVPFLQKLENPFASLQRRWATKKVAGGKRNTKDSAGKRLGLKKTQGSLVEIGQIIVRQRGTKFHPGSGCFLGRDHTLHAERNGVVKFWYDLPRRRAYCAVDDGSLEPWLPTKDESKKRLASMVDLEKYMGLYREDRHRYMMELVQQYDQEMQKETVELAKKWVETRQRRLPGLIDLTKL